MPRGTGAPSWSCCASMVGVVAGWAPDRPCYLAVDSAYAGRMLLEQRPPNVQIVSRLRPDAALWATAPKRRPGQKGRPRRRGARLPTPQQVAARCRRWHPLTVAIYGRTVTTQVRTMRALWYAALRTQPVQIVLVRDPTGKRRDEAFFCTDRAADARFILEAYARRWCLEVTFHDAKQFLGFADPQCQTPRAVQRTAPFAFVVYDLVLLWFAEHAATTTSPGLASPALVSAQDHPVLQRYARRLAGGPGPATLFGACTPCTAAPQIRLRHRQRAISGPPNGGSRV